MTTVVPAHVLAEKRKELAERRRLVASTIVAAAIAEGAGNDALPQDPPEDRWPAMQQLLMLALDDDPAIAHLAGQELLARLAMPAIPLAHDDGRRRILRRG